MLCFTVSAAFRFSTALQTSSDTGRYGNAFETNGYCGLGDEEFGRRMFWSGRLCFFVCRCCLHCTLGMIKSKSTLSGSFVSANFDFYYADCEVSRPVICLWLWRQTPLTAFLPRRLPWKKAAHGKKNADLALVGVNYDGTEYALVGDVTVGRNNQTGDLLFDTLTTNTSCFDFSTFPTPPFPFVSTQTGVFTGGTGAFP